MYSGILLSDAGLLGACGSTSIRVANDRQGCSVATDCAVIHVGDPCACRRGTAAIALVDKPRADADRSAIDCGSACSTADAWQAVAPFCDAGGCAVRPVPIP